ncbi:MAG: c-type cytochrome [Desertimonas sp.]
MYPIWEGVGTHSAMYVAIVAVFHVVASHLTVGAAWFNVYVERKAYHENRPELYEYLKRSALGLQVFAYVFGAMSGVGIWQATTAANPRGISGLIHNFVLVWGSEWYMFMIDVLGIIAYYYTLGRIDRRTHLRLAWILALGGTGTLTLIVGILGFKLTPGLWLDNGEVLSGFFNPTFWPQFFLRLFLMLTITGAWAILIASRMKRDFAARASIIRWAGIIGLGGLAAAMFVGRFWYWDNLTDHARDVLGSVAMPAITYQVIFGAVAVMFVGLLYAAVDPGRMTTFAALGLFVVLYTGIFGAERTREILRKPDIISGYMSSNGLVFDAMEARGVPDEEAPLNEHGMLGGLPFIPELVDIDVTGTEYPTAEVAAGRVLVTQQCASCHSVSDQTALPVFGNDLALRPLDELFPDRMRTTDAAGIELILGSLGGYSFMHEVVGTEEDHAAMAAYLEWLVAQDHPPAVAVDQAQEDEP